jgi:hypothetical protein
MCMTPFRRGIIVIAVYDYGASRLFVTSFAPAKEPKSAGLVNALRNADQISSASLAP